MICILKQYPCSPTVYCFSRFCIDPVFIAVFMTYRVSMQMHANKYANAHYDSLMLTFWVT